MNLEIKKLASKTMLETADWIERENTSGAGDRWLDKLIKAVKLAADTKVKYAPCKYGKFAKRGYHCFTYNDKWVVAYRIKGNSFIVCRFVWGAKLK